MGIDAAAVVRLRDMIRTEGKLPPRKDDDFTSLIVDLCEVYLSEQVGAMEILEELDDLPPARSAFSDTRAAIGSVEEGTKCDKCAEIRDAFEEEHHNFLEQLGEFNRTIINLRSQRRL